MRISLLKGQVLTCVVAMKFTAARRKWILNFCLQNQHFFCPVEMGFSGKKVRCKFLPAANSISILEYYNSHHALTARLLPTASSVSQKVQAWGKREGNIGEPPQVHSSDDMPLIQKDQQLTGKGITMPLGISLQGVMLPYLPPNFRLA